MLRALARSVLPLLFAAALTAQTAVVLPGGTGTLTAPAAWTVLQGSALAATSRATDPKDEPARALVQQTIAQLQKDGRTEQHTLLHSVTEAGELRLVNTWSVDGSATSEQLQRDDVAKRMRETLEPSLAAPGTKVTFRGHRKADAFTAAGIVLRFEEETPLGTFVLDHWVAPAGKRMQYFETLHAIGDTAAEATFAVLLRTFDGASDAPPDDLTRQMLVGGAFGAVGGVLFAIWRTKRRRALAGSIPQAR